MRDDDDVEPWRDLVATENLSYQSFSSISSNGAADFFRRRDAQAPDGPLGRQDEGGAVAAANTDATVIHALELGTAANPFRRAEPHSLLTVRRFRPFARRRFSTSRPFFVLIRTRNPCVRFRRRLLG